MFSNSSRLTTWSWFWNNWRSINYKRKSKFAVLHLRCFQKIIVLKVWLRLKSEFLPSVGVVRSQTFDLKIRLCNVCFFRSGSVVIFWLCIKGCNVDIIYKGEADFAEKWIIFDSFVQWKLKWFATGMKFPHIVKWLRKIEEEKRQI